MPMIFKTEPVPVVLIELVPNSICLVLLLFDINVPQDNDADDKSNVPFVSVYVRVTPIVNVPLKATVPPTPF